MRKSNEYVDGAPPTKQRYRGIKQVIVYVEVRRSYNRCSFMACKLRKDVAMLSRLMHFQNLSLRRNQKELSGADYRGLILTF